MKKLNLDLTQAKPSPQDEYYYQLLDDLIDNTYNMTSWEIDFVNDLHSQGLGLYFDKQKEIIDRIYDKAF